MHFFKYKQGHLHCEDVSLKTLSEKYGTPLYVYSKATILDHYRRLKDKMSSLDCLICYATKANSNISVLNLLVKEGSGFDVVSGGEMFRIKKAGGDLTKCTFAGVGKTRDEIEFGLKESIYSFNVESQSEIFFINEIAKKLNLIAPIAIRVNPNVDAKTHKYISTGKSENKFGIDFDNVSKVYEETSKLKNIKIKGLQMHIGSQLSTIDPFIESIKKVTDLVYQLKDKYNIEFFSIGGGIGIIYEDTLASNSKEWWDNKNLLNIDTYAEKLIPLLKPLDLKIILEPGRYLVGNAGVLLTKVLYEKKGNIKTFKIIDAAMNDLVRPALYEGHHDIVPLKEPKEDTKYQVVDIVGPVCESGDFFAQLRELPELLEGDEIAVLSSGAYGFVMASNYNSRPMPAEIMVNGCEFDVIRERQDYNDLIRGEKLI